MRTLPACIFWRSAHVKPMHADKQCTAPEAPLLAPGFFTGAWRPAARPLLGLPEASLSTAGHVL